MTPLKTTESLRTANTPRLRNFRLLTRLLTQMQRVIEINQLSEFSIDVIETARENLVIGQA